MSTIIHGHTIRPKDGSPRRHSPEYNSYGGMKDRCYNESHVRYHRYGGRGIKVCDRWLHGEDGKTGFQCFLEDLGEKPAENYSLDRIDSDKDYSPENVRWSSTKWQSRNKSTTRYVEINGERLCLADAVEKYSEISYATVRMRIQRGWSEIDAILTPKQ